MKLYKTTEGAVIEEHGDYQQLPEIDWDVLINRNDLDLVLTSLTRRAKRIEWFDPDSDALAPIGRQEVWAAGVT